MRRTIARSIALAALVAGAAWAQQLTFTCTPAALPAVVGEVVSVTCDVPSGGIPPYTWSISPANALPPGLSQDVTTGNITGTLADPAVPYSFTVIATDNSTLDTGSQLYSGTTTDFTVTCTVATGPVEVFVLYSNSCTAAGGTPPYNWTIVGQTVPPGLTGGSITPNGNSATIAFTPLGPPAAYQYGVEATDTSTPPLTKGQPFTGAIAPAVAIGTASSLPPAVVGSLYSQLFAATGGVGSYSWGATGLSNGLTMSTSGLLSGTPTSTSTVSFTATVTDSAGGTSSGPFTVTVNPALAITTTSPLPTAVVGQTYTQSFSATGGSGSGYNWSVSGQPAWLSMTPGGVLSGIPPSPAVSSTFTVKVTDSAGNTASGSFTLPVTLAITTAPALPTATIGKNYNQTLAAIGGAPPYQWTVTTGSLPAGLSLSTGGAISGTPQQAAVNASFTATVTDSNNASVSAPLTLPVTLAITTTSPLPTATIGTAYSQTFAAEGGAGGYTWTATGLPAWLALSTTGALTASAVPATALDASFTVQVTDSAKGTVSAQFTVPVALSITTALTLPAAVVNTAYSQTFAASGGSGGYTWSATGLPAWASLSTGGTLMGMPATVGPVSFSVTVKDSSGVMQTNPFTLQVNPPLAITTSSPLANGIVGVSYNQTLTGMGGVTPYRWSLTTGSLPGGLLLGASNGVISGQPTAAGTSQFTIQLSDNATPANTISKPFVITIGAGVTITTTPTLPNATVGVAYKQTLAAAGGAVPYTWSPAGPLPGALAALSLNASGAIAGSPTATGTGTFPVTVTDSAGSTNSQTFTLTVVTPPVINTASLPNGTAGVAYSQTLAASGGTPPYTWTLASGSLPGGLSLSTGGAITGMPGASGTFNFKVQLTDATGVTAGKAFTLTIVAGLTISTTSPLPTGEAAIAYSQTLAAAGGTSPYTWSVTAGTLPPGLKLAASGSLTGTPGTAGTFNFTVQAADSNNVTASTALAVTIAGVLGISTPAALNEGSLNASYSQTLAASAGVSPYTWTLTTGSLPQGLNLSTAGTVAGVPVATGTFSFTAKVTDSLGATASRQFTIVIAIGLTVSTPPTLPGATVGVPYADLLQASGGTAPYTWTNPAGSPPAGVSVSSNGNLTGVPTAAGSSSFTVQVTDSLGHQASAQLSITVAPAPSITTSALPGGTVGAAYSQTLAAAGGTPPYTWAFPTGSLPAGLTLSTAGAITGAPTATGTFQFTATVTDSASGKASQQFTLIVAGGLAITTTTLPGGKVGTSYSQTLTATGGTPPYTFATSAGSLPPGITLTGAVLSGTPTKTGSYTFTIQVTDSVSATATEQLTIAITGLAITTSAPLPGAAVGTAYSQALVAAGGTPPYTWALTGGAPPAGLTLSSAGAITGTPTAAGTSSVTIQVTDSTKATASAAFTLTVISASFSGLSSTAAAAQQLSGTLAPGAAYPQEITGQVTLAFQPDASLASPADDPSIQFSTGGRTASFTIPANSTAPVPFSLQTGTVAGNRIARPKRVI